MKVDFEELKAMMEKVNAAFMLQGEEYRIESLEKTEKEILALCELKDAFDSLQQVCGKSITTVEYEKIKERILNALIEVDEILNPPSIEYINQFSKAFHRSK